MGPGERAVAELGLPVGLARTRALKPDGSIALQAELTPRPRSPTNLDAEVGVVAVGRKAGGDSGRADGGLAALQFVTTTLPMTCRLAISRRPSGARASGTLCEMWGWMRPLASQPMITR